MLKAFQLRQNSLAKMRSARSAGERGDWDEATYLCGLAVEMILKARITADRKLPGWPQNGAEFDSLRPLKLKVHALDDLLELTSFGGHIRGKFLNEWGACLQWNIESRYQPQGTATQESVQELVRAAETVIRELSGRPGLEAAVVAETDNVYVKLWALEREISAEKGSFCLFALWHRKNAPASSDLVVSAPWLDAYSRSGAKHIADRVMMALKGPSTDIISGLIVIDPYHPIIAQSSAAMKFEHRIVEMKNLIVNGVRIDFAVFITLKPLPRLR